MWEYENKNTKKYICLAALVIGLLGGILMTAVLTYRQKESPEEIQQGIAKEIFRFHVLANSDEEEDQKLKLQVKTDVVHYLETALGETHSLEETRQGVEKHLEDIVDVAKQTISNKGYSYPVTAQVTKTYFPVKTYGDCTFPAGEYEALQIKIGEAKGKNWWCVLYPSLCFLDETYAVVTEEKVGELKELLTEDEFEAVTGSPEVKIKFRWLNGLELSPKKG